MALETCFINEKIQYHSPIPLNKTQVNYRLKLSHFMKLLLYLILAIDSHFCHPDCKFEALINCNNCDNIP